MARNAETAARAVRWLTVSASVPFGPAANLGLLGNRENSVKRRLMRAVLPPPREILELHYSQRKWHSKSENSRTIFILRYCTISLNLTLFSVFKLHLFLNPDVLHYEKRLSHQAAFVGF